MKEILEFYLEYCKVYMRVHARTSRTYIETHLIHIEVTGNKSCNFPRSANSNECRAPLNTRAQESRYHAIQAGDKSNKFDLTHHNWRCKSQKEPQN